MAAGKKSFITTGSGERNRVPVSRGQRVRVLGDDFPEVGEREEGQRAEGALGQDRHRLRGLVPQFHRPP